jgi:hypothetical protein
MANEQRIGGLEKSWRKIPAGRRHVYVYILLLLGAVAGNNFKNAMVGADEEDFAATGAEIARMQGMKESTQSLYH